jgi:two-component system, OmpR family, phosphate regulon sensor histidine kinase PhoR
MASTYLRTFSDRVLPWADRLRRARFILAVAAIILLALAAVDILSLMQSLAGFAIVIIAMLIPFEGEATAAGAAAYKDRASQSEWLLESIISGVPEAMIALDRECRIVAWNAAAQKITLPLVRGAPLSLSLRNPDVIEAARRAVRSGRPETAEFYERTPVDRWTEAQLMPIAVPESSGDERELVLLTLHDLTPLRRVEEVRSDFIANASHELRTPLASLAGFIETLQGSARDDPKARDKFLGIMNEQATRMARMIDDLLSLSRVELKEHVPPEQRVNLTDIVRQVSNSLLPLAQERKVEIKTNFPSEPMLILGDHDELMRVFENLIDNALKYGASGKRVDISLSLAPEGDAVADVRDYGQGIASKHLPRLTERFYRGDVSESRAMGGTGLGLALVKHIINRHRGKLAIDSTPGKGATFSVRLPLAK